MNMRKCASLNSVPYENMISGELYCVVKGKNFDISDGLLLIQKQSTIVRSPND